MKDVVLVIAFNRVSFVNTCLKHISLCDGIDDCEVWLSEDTHDGVHSYDIPAFKNFRHLMWPHPISRDYPKEHYLSAMRAVYGADVQHIFIVEDDVAVSKDFLLWSKKAYAAFNPYVTCGVNVWTKPTTNPHEVGISHSDFAIWGICTRRENLAECIERTDRHPEETFHNHLIRDKALMVFPSQPRAYNYGHPLRQGMIGEFGNATNDPLQITEDRCSRWQAAYQNQAQWGF